VRGRVYVKRAKLVEKSSELLKTDAELSFLLRLKQEEVERLVACIRDKVDRIREVK
jgi:hypothetical protein